MKESTLEKRLKVAVKESKGLCLKMPSQWYRGIPDRLILLPGGRVYFVELKTLINETSTHQKYYQLKLTKLGFNTYIIKGRNQLERFIEEHVKV
jgi:hypothetical protein